MLPLGIRLSGIIRGQAAVQGDWAHAAGAAGQVASQAAQAMPWRCDAEARCSSGAWMLADAARTGLAVNVGWGSAAL